jgi:hypothetical protein
MEPLKIPFLKQSNSGLALAEISVLLHEVQSNSIGYAPWQKLFKMPVAAFSIAYTDDCLYLKYKVEESYITAKYREINDPVYKDSCVEFFIAFNHDQSYYNLEFNCLGTVLAAYGSGKENRVNLPKELLKEITSETCIKSPATENYNGAIVWEMVLRIPLKTFLFHQLDNLSKKRCHVNFYKCGDDLPEPHFLCWTNIVSDTPDFHLPEYFGLAEFV